MRTYYDVLGVQPDADDVAIRQAFRMLAKSWHPDSNAGDGSAQRFKQVTAAYVTLRNSASRAAYDEDLAAARRWRGERRTREAIHEAIYYVIAAMVTVGVVTGGMSYFRPRPEAVAADASPAPEPRWRSRPPEQQISTEIGAAARETPAYHDDVLLPTAVRPDVEAYRAATLESSRSSDRMEATTAGTAVTKAASAGEFASRPAGHPQSVVLIDAARMRETDGGSYPHPRDRCLQTGTCLGRALGRR